MQGERTSRSSQLNASILGSPPHFCELAELARLDRNPRATASAIICSWVSSSATLFFFLFGPSCSAAVAILGILPDRSLRQAQRSAAASTTTSQLQHCEASAAAVPSAQASTAAFVHSSAGLSFEQCYSFF